MADRFRGTLVEAQWLAPSVRWMRFRVEPPLSYEAGQWVNVGLPSSDGAGPGSLVRAYSIASSGANTEGNTVEFAVTQVDGGVGSSAICGLPSDASVELEGPFGIFTLERAAEAPGILFVATGTGVTPIRAMIQAELSSRTTRPIALLFGCRTKEDVLFGEEFRQLAERHERFRYCTTLSREDAAAEGSAGDARVGYVQAHLGDLISFLQARSEGTPHVMVCGLTEMVRGVREELKSKHGFTRALIHAERYD